jgi:putative ABC transport system permease protein
MAFFLDDDNSAEEAAAMLGERLRGRQNVIIQSSRSLRAAALDIFDRTFTITAALQLLATIVAFIGVLSALMSLQLERARELGILRATGMTIDQMWRLTFLETGLMGATAGLLAMPVGWILAWILIHVINLRSFGWTMEMMLTPGLFLQAVLVALAAALLAGIYPAFRLGKTDISRTIRQE